MRSPAERWSALQTATVADATNGVGAMSAEIRRLVPGPRIAGPARTILTPPDDFLSVGDAISEAPPGCVLVAATNSNLRGAYAGANMAKLMMKQKIAGLVTDGCVRDLEDIIAMGFPVFGAGVTPRASDWETKGLIDVPVLVGGCLVAPGDWIIGDIDGVMVVAADQAEDALSRSEALAVEDERTLASIDAGARWDDLLSH